ncbi:MAG: helix-turn-helix domain-containing protein [Bacteroidota bacterium]
MNTVRQWREKRGFTQTELAEKAGLSLRTIQRLEASDKAPKGHSLSALAQVFQVEPSELLQAADSQKQDTQSDLFFIKVLNLAGLAFFLFPFANVFLPIVLWRRGRKSPAIDEAARIIINFQVLWSICLCLFLILAPFIGDGILWGFPTILIVLYGMIVLDLMVIALSAFWISKGQLERLKLPLRLL